MKTWVYLKYKMRSAYNMTASHVMKKKTATRTGTARKKVTATFFVVSMILVIVGFFMFSAINLSDSLRVHMLKPVGSSDETLGFECGRSLVAKRSQRVEAKKNPVACEKRAVAQQSVVTESFYRYLSMKLFFVFFCGLMAIFVTTELAAREWDLEWLFTLPLSSRELMNFRIIEGTLLNGFVLIFFIPLASVMMFKTAVPWPLMVGGTVLGYLALSFCVACYQTVISTGSRLFLKPERLKNGQAIMSVVSVLAGLGLMFPEFDRHVLHPLSVYPIPVIDWLPSGLLAKILTTKSLGVTFTCVAMLLAEMMLSYAVCIAILSYLLRNGIVVGGFQEAVRSSGDREKAISQSVFGWSWLGPVTRKELALLGRDRTLMVQTAFLPFAIVAANTFFALEAGEKMGLNTLAATSFATACYAMITATFQVLVTETKTLWLISSLPHPLEKIFLKKVVPWVVFLILFPLPIFFVKVGPERIFSWEVFSMWLFTTCGILIFSVISTCFGYFSCDPFSDKARPRISPGYMNLFMILAGFFSFAIWKEDAWTRLILLILSAATALSFWQRMKDSILYLQDPTAEPPTRVAFSDGMLALLLFYMIQSGYTFLVEMKFKSFPLSHLFIAFGIAGWILFAALHIYYFLSKAINTPSFFGPQWKRSLIGGAVLGALLGGMAFFYLQVGENLHWISLPEERTWKWVNSLIVGLTMMIAGPLCQEYIFRGVMFSGLTRVVKPNYAIVISAFLFASVYPLALTPILFVMGLSAAWLYKTTKVLIGPIVLHMIFNLLIFLSLNLT